METGSETQGYPSHWERLDQAISTSSGEWPTKDASPDWPILRRTAASFSTTGSSPMLGNIGGAELALIMMVILLVFGAKRIPEIARGLGQGIREFKKATSEISRELKLDDDATRRPHPQSAPPRPEPVYHSEVTRPETATGPTPE